MTPVSTRFSITPIQRESLQLSALLILPIVIAVAVYARVHSPIIEIDSGSYLDWSPYRTSVYPLFLRLIPWKFLLPIQLLIFALSVSWVIYYTHRWTHGFLLAALLGASLLTNPYVWQLQASVMSEAVTTPLLVLMVGFLTGYLVKTHPADAIFSSLVAGLLAAARPSNLPLILIPGLAVLLAHKPRTSGRLWLIVLCTTISLSLIIADKLVDRAVHGDATTSLIGPHTFAKSVLVDAPALKEDEFTPVEVRVASLAQTGFQPIRDVLRAASNRPHIFGFLQGNYEACLEAVCTYRALRDVSVPRPVLNAALFHIGVDRLKKNPVAYLKLTLDEYSHLWLLNPRTDPELAHELNAYLSVAAPLPYQSNLGVAATPVSSGEYSRTYALIRKLFIAIGFLSLAALPALCICQFIKSSTPPLTASFVYLVGAQAVLLFSCLVGIGTPRYTIGMWPLIAAAFALIAAFLSEAFWTRKQRKPGI